MKRFAVFLTLALLSWSTLAAEELTAVVVDVAGKVEFKSTAGTWKAARIGDFITKGTVVSTGFKSTAVLKVGESVINVKPVTRLSLEELLKTKGGTQTQLYLTAGRIQVEVTPSRTEKVEFSVKSPTATASVRGTGFEFDGFNLLVTHGMVELGNNWGQFRYVGAGEYSYLDTDSSVSIPIAANPESGLQRLDELVQQTHVETKAGSTTITGEAKINTGPKAPMDLQFN